jgi:hypothetical protein
LGAAATAVAYLHAPAVLRAQDTEAFERSAAEQGFQVLETIPHPTLTRGFNDVVLKGAEPRSRHSGGLLQ